MRLCQQGGKDNTPLECGAAVVPKKRRCRINNRSLDIFPAGTYSVEQHSPNAKLLTGIARSKDLLNNVRVPNTQVKV